MFSYFKFLNSKEQILWGYFIPLSLLISAATLVYLNAQQVNQQTASVEQAYTIIDDIKDLALTFNL